MEMKGLADLRHTSPSPPLLSSVLPLNALHADTCGHVFLILDNTQVNQFSRAEPGEVPGLHLQDWRRCQDPGPPDIHEFLSNSRSAKSQQEEALILPADRKYK
ncbi:hypothetical protein GN956_G2811 [Arapaima gigas]